jgi:hypothetical protein
MKTNRRVYSLATLFIAAFAITIASLVSFNTFSQTSKGADTGNIPVVWNRVELPVKPIDSSFRIDMPSFNSGADYIIGVKPIKEGEKERMFAGIVTWETNEKMKGFIKTASIENYPAEAGGFTEGKAAFNDVLRTGQTLVIYMEVASTTRLTVNKAEGEMPLRSSDRSFVVFEGKREATNIDGPSALLNELHGRKMQQELIKNGVKMSLNRKEND